MTLNDIVQTAYTALSTVVLVSSIVLPILPKTGAWVYVREIVGVMSLAEKDIKAIATGGKPTAAQAVEGVAKAVEQDAAANDANAAVATVKNDLK